MKCYLCKHEASIFLRKNGFEVFVCPHCGLKETDLRQDYAQFIESYYSKGYFTGEREYGAYADYKKDKPFIQKNMMKLLKMIMGYKTKGKLLDVGCAMGFFVELALQKGFDAYGFDPSAFATMHAKELVGDRVKEGTIQSLRFLPKSFDVITLFDVVEHLGDPLADIKRLSVYLKDDGIIVFATGNSDSLAATLLRRRWTFYTPPQHLFFFNPSTFASMLQKAHLTVVGQRSVGKWLSLRYVLNLARSNGESNTAHLLHSVVQKLHIGSIPLYLSMHDNMVVIARKSVGENN